MTYEVDCITLLWTESRVKVC